MNPLRPEAGSGHSTLSSSRSSESFASSQSTDLTSVLIGYTPSLLVKETAAAEQDACRPMAVVRPMQPSPRAHGEDLSPSTKCYPRASTDTYASTDEEEPQTDDDEADEDNAVWAEHEDPLGGPEAAYECYTSGYDSDRDDDGLAIVPPLPAYRHDPVNGIVRPTTPQGFAQLFPSIDRMSVRHDEFTSDGNMNLRVDMAVPVHLPGHDDRVGAGVRRRAGAPMPVSYQLFHLRMYDLARRSFSLRRYCRDSGREVCSTKLVFDNDAVVDDVADDVADESCVNEESSARRLSFQRSMSTALRSLGGSAGRRRPGSSGSGSGSSAKSTKSVKSSKSTKSSRSVASLSSLFDRSRGTASAATSVAPARPRPTKTVRLEFSNYARVDVNLRESPSSPAAAFYDFEWWGHQYTWVRVEERHLPGVVQFHLLRDYDERLGPDAAAAAADVVAHIVPESRSPNQEAAEAAAGGWIPACHMWISDPSVLAAMTDVADVIMATGLVALVDDAIRARWPTAAETRRRLLLHDQLLQQQHHAHLLAQRRRRSSVGSIFDGRSHSFMGSLFHRRASHGAAGLLRPPRQVIAY